MVSLDDALSRAAALEDPGGFVNHYGAPLFIDEVGAAATHSCWRSRLAPIVREPKGRW